MMVFSKITVSITSFLDVAAQSLEISWRWKHRRGENWMERVVASRSTSKLAYLREAVAFMITLSYVFKAFLGNWVKNWSYTTFLASSSSRRVNKHLSTHQSVAAPSRCDSKALISAFVIFPAIAGAGLQHCNARKRSTQTQVLEHICWNTAWKTGKIQFL